MLFMHCLPLARALDINHQEAKRVSEIYQNQHNGKSKNEAVHSISVVLPNYNNGHIIEEAVESIFCQRRVRASLYIIDNASTDGSWDIIKKLSLKNQNIHALRTRSNLGPHLTTNILLRLPLTEFTLLASGNDVLLDPWSLSTFANFLSSNTGYDLVYGRNVRQSQFAEPQRFCFSIPSPQRRNDLGITALDAMDIATWLYTSSEPLWGLYRSDALKTPPPVAGYGADHVLLTSVSFAGGVAGLDIPFRQVEIEKRNQHDLLSQQLQHQYAGKERFQDCLSSGNFSMMSLSYYEGLRHLYVAPFSSHNAVDRALTILVKRFYRHLIQEAIGIRREYNRLEEDVKSRPMTPTEAYTHYTRYAFFSTVIIPLLKREALESNLITSTGFAFI